MTKKEELLEENKNTAPTDEKKVDAKKKNKTDKLYTFTELLSDLEYSVKQRVYVNLSDDNLKNFHKENNIWHLCVRPQISFRGNFKAKDLANNKQYL